MFACVMVSTVFLGKMVDYLEKRRERKLMLDCYPDFPEYKVEGSDDLFIQTTIQANPPSALDEPAEAVLQADRRLHAIHHFLNAFKNVDKRKEFSGKYRYLILGGSGMGKTTFLLNLYLRYLDIWRGTRFDIKLLTVSNLKKETFEGWTPERKNKTILLLDSLDEDPKASVHYEVRMQEVADLVDQFRFVLLTCRTQFFPDCDSRIYELKVPSLDNRIIKFQKHYLSPFTIDECKSYIRRKFYYLRWDRINKGMKVLQTSSLLMVRPMLLSNIDLLLNIDSKVLNTYSVYKALIEGWLDREAEKQENYHTVEEKKRFRRDLSTFSEASARFLLLKLKAGGPLTMSSEEADAIAKETGIDLTPWKITGKSLLNTDLDQNWKFSHKSIFEFYCAKRALCNVAQLQTVAGHGLTFSEKIISEMQNVFRPSWIENVKKCYLGLGMNSYVVTYDVHVSGPRKVINGSNFELTKTESVTILESNLSAFDFSKVPNAVLLALRDSTVESLRFDFPQRLRYIDLTGSICNEITYGTGGFTELRHFNCSFATLELYHIIERIGPTLKFLGLADTFIRSIAPLAACTYLQVLDLGYSQPLDESDDYSVFRHLEILSLIEIPLLDITFLLELPNLQKVFVTSGPWQQGEIPDVLMEKIVVVDQLLPPNIAAGRYPINDRYALLRGNDKWTLNSITSF